MVSPFTHTELNLEDLDLMARALWELAFASEVVFLLNNVDNFHAMKRHLRVDQKLQ